MSAGAGNAAVESLAAATLIFAPCYPPFDEMEDEPLRDLPPPAIIRKAQLP